MDSQDETDSDESDDFRARIADATAFLEQVRDDYAALAELPLAERERFLMAAGQVARPGPWAKRELASRARQRHEAAKLAHDERLLEVTGIRQSRRQRVFTPWQHGATIDRTGSDAGSVTPHLLERAPVRQPAQLAEEVHCYVCNANYREVHFFYDALCPACAELNWDKRSPKGRPARPRRRRHRGTGEDRLPRRPDAAPRRSSGDRHHPLSA